MAKCIMCRVTLTGVRKDKKYCSDAHRAQFSRLKRFIVAKEQGRSETGASSLSTEDWCFQHEVEKSICSGFKHE